MAPLGWIEGVLLGQRGRLSLWVPVMLSIGIGSYFALSWEPGARHYLATGALVLAAVVLAWRIRPEFAPLPLALALAAAGFVLAGGRAHLVEAPVLGFRYWGPVEGRIVGIDRSAGNLPRVTLDRVVLSRVDPDKTPARVRISLQSAEQFQPPQAGLRVIVTAHLSPPEGPVEPGGFDFQRNAWFGRLGAIGYAQTPMLALESPARGDWAAALFALRMKVADQVRAGMPGAAGGFAAALLTGDRSSVDGPVLADLRASNLAHLLAISGLHMGLLTGFVFGTLRLAIAAIAPLALRVSGKKVAAAVALVAAFGYLGLSGASVATQRAFVMAAVMLVAILADRRALTLRAVALAAVIVLLLRPESLVEPGFQMSFAATAALVGVFAFLRDAGRPRDQDRRRMPRWLRPAFTLLISSAVAGAATAPISAFHFNQIAQYGLLANMLSVPVMGMLVMPAGVIALLLVPLGLAAPAFAVMGAGIDWILGIASWVAGMDGALWLVRKPDAPLLAPLVLGGLVLILWHGRWRILGLAPILAALVLWQGAGRPDVLVSSSGRLVGVMTDQGRWLSKPRGDGFTASSWLENDGDGATQPAASMRVSGRVAVRVLTGKAPDMDEFNAACRTGDVLVLPDARSADLVRSVAPTPARAGANPPATAAIRGASGPAAAALRPAILVRADAGHPRSAEAADRTASAGREGGAGPTATKDLPCVLIDRKTLADLGAFSVSGLPQAPVILGARQVTGPRLWRR